MGMRILNYVKQSRLQRKNKRIVLISHVRESWFSFYFFLLPVLAFFSGLAYFAARASKKLFDSCARFSCRLAIIILRASSLPLAPPVRPRSAACCSASAASREEFAPLLAFAALLIDFLKAENLGTSPSFIHFSIFSANRSSSSTVQHSTQSRMKFMFPSPSMYAFFRSSSSSLENRYCSSNFLMSEIVTF